MCSPFYSTSAVLGITYLIRYAFPYEELEDGIIDMTEEQKLFYVNPYSGELSLKFPRTEKRCRGGILACVAIYPLLRAHMLTIIDLLQRWFVVFPSVPPPHSVLESYFECWTI